MLLKWDMPLKLLFVPSWHYKKSRKTQRNSLLKLLIATKGPKSSRLPITSFSQNKTDFGQIGGKPRELKRRFPGWWRQIWCSWWPRKLWQSFWLKLSTVEASHSSWSRQLLRKHLESFLKSPKKKVSYFVSRMLARLVRSRNLRFPNQSFRKRSSRIWLAPLLKAIVKLLALA